MLNKYKGGVSGAAPLQMQITAHVSNPIRVVGFFVCGENSSGSASKPVLTRPSSPGSGTQVTAEKLSPSAPVSGAYLATSFSSPPSLPSVNVGAFNLPLRIRWTAALGQEFVVAQQKDVLLYAYASGGHTWTGEIIWEEAS